MEAQGDWADLRGSSVSIINPANINRSRIDAFGLFTGQVGYALNTALLYLKGGAAVVADRNDMLLRRRGRGDDRRATTVGAARSAAVWNTASPRTGRRPSNTTICSSPITTPHFTIPPGRAGFSAPTALRGDADLVTVRVNYRWGGPVVAKY